MTNKFALYRFIAPFRSRLQNRLRKERMSVDVDAFACAFEGRDQHAEITHLLWEMLREQSFVADFRPLPDDNLSEIYAMGPEEVRDDVIEPLLTKLGLSVREIDFTGLEFASIATPKDVTRLVMKLAEARGRASAGAKRDRG